MNPALDHFLAASGLAAPGTPRTWTPLTGGVSSDIWRVDLGDGRSVCVKRALAKLKVAADWEAPVSRNAFEWRWMQFAATVIPSAVPEPIAHDEVAGLFAMAFLPADQYPLWKAQLLAGAVDVGTAAAVGTRLGQLHRASAHREDLARAFDTTDNFRALRLNPYLIATAARHPALSPQLLALAEATARQRVALVHGDVSPKNILVGPNGPVFLDAECAWYGDPAFDIAFCLNHLLLKAVMRPERSALLSESFDAFTAAYFEQVAAMEPRATLEARAAALLPALLLARVDGKSPVEYITTDPARERVRAAALPLVQTPVAQLWQVADHAYAQLTCAPPKGPSPMPDQNLAQHLIALEEQRCRSVVEQRFDALAALLSERLVHTHTRGNQDNKASYIAFMSGTIESLDLRRTDVQVIPLGEDVAVLHGRQVNRARKRGTVEEITIEAIVTQTWHREADGQWRIVASHASSLGALPPAVAR